MMDNKIVVGTNVLKRVLVHPIEVWSVVEVRMLEYMHYLERPEDFKPIPLTMHLLHQMLSYTEGRFYDIDKQSVEFKFDPIKGKLKVVTALLDHPCPLTVISSLSELQVFLCVNELVCPRIRKVDFLSLGYQYVLIKDEDEN